MIYGETPSETYERVRSVFDSVPAGDAMRYLVCEIADPRDAERVPAAYPKQGEREEVQAWMADLVEWWQLAEPQLGKESGLTMAIASPPPRRSGRAGASELLARAIPGDPDTTRAAILLLDPLTESSPATGEFPSFVSVQLQLVPSGQGWRLDCTGSFRKQEMRYWWPINVAELYKIQRAVSAKITIGDQHPRVGVLRTVTAHAIAEDRLPVVAVPAVDRAVDQRPETLWRMAYGLIEPQKAGDAPRLRATWDRYLAELRPARDSDSVPAMSRRGLQTVLRFVQAVGIGQSSRATVRALEALVKLYALFRDPQAAAPEATRIEVANRLDALDDELDAQFGRLPAPPK